MTFNSEFVSTVFDNKGVVLTRSGWLMVPITQQMYDWAIPRAEELGKLHNSIRDGEGNLAGMLGEAAVLRGLPGSKSLNTYQHDIEYDGLTLEVKSKDRTVSPAGDYEASVANFNSRQTADRYVFTSLVRDERSGVYTVCYVMGMMEKNAYMRQSRFLREGDWDYRNNYYVKADCHNLEYSKLDNFDHLEAIYP